MSRILIIRDEVFKLTVEGRLPTGHADAVVTVVPTAEEALEHIRAHAPELVVITSALSSVTPAEFCSSVKGLPSAAHTRQLFMESADQADRAEQFRAAGGDVVLPVTAAADRLTEVLAELLGQKTTLTNGVAIRILGRLEVVGADGKAAESSFANLVELSVSGARVILKGPPPEGATLRLSFVLPGTGTRTTVAVVVRSVVDAAQHQYALGFEHVDATAAEQLAALVERRTTR